MCLFGSVFASAEAVPQATLDGVAYTVMSAYYGPGDQENVPMEGMQFLTVTLQMKNETTQALPLPQPQRLMAGCGDWLYRPLLASGASALPAMIQPGESLLADWIFEIPAAKGDYTLITVAADGTAVNTALPLGQNRQRTSTADTPWLLTPKAGLSDAPKGQMYLRRLMTVTGPYTEANLAMDLNGKSLTPVYPVRAGSQLGLLGITPSANQSLTGYVWYLVDEKAQLPFEAITAVETVAPGLTVTQANWQITLNSLKDRGSGKNRLWIANLTVTNNATKEVIVSGALGFHLLDAQGNEVPHAFDYDGKTLDVKLMPGQSVTGEVAFKLSDSPSALRVHLNMLGEPLLIPLNTLTK